MDAQLFAKKLKLLGSSKREDVAVGIAMLRVDDHCYLKGILKLKEWSGAPIHGGTERLLESVIAADDLTKEMEGLEELETC